MDVNLDPLEKRLESLENLINVNVNLDPLEKRIEYLESLLAHIVRRADYGTFVKIFGDTMTGQLNVPNVNVGGITAATALLELAAGTTSVAPLKFTTGSFLTTPEQGAFEYGSGHLLFSPQDSVRYAVVMANGVKTSTTEVTNTTTETTIYTKDFAANELHVDEVITITAMGIYTNASASDDFTIRWKLDGVTVHTASRIGGNETDAGWEALARITIRTAGASGEFVDFFRYDENNGNSYQSGDSTTHSIDTTTTHTFSITMQWDNAKAGNLFYCTQGFIQLSH